MEHANEWREGILTIGANTTTTVSFRPECYSFSTDPKTVSLVVKFCTCQHLPVQVVPYVELEVKEQKGDHQAVEKVKASVKQQLKELLSFRPVKSQDISLFAAANLLFPSAKVMTVKSFFVTGWEAVF